MPLHVAGNVLAELLHIHRALGPGPDHAHIPADDVDELRQLVHRELAQDSAQTGLAGVVRGGPARPARLRVGAHGAKFDHGEGAGVQAHALLNVEHRAGGFQLDKQGDEQHEGGEEDQGGDGDGQVIGPFQRKPPPAQGHIAHRQQGQPRQVADRDLGGHDLKHVREDLDAHLLPFAQGDDAHQFAMGRLGQADDHLVDPVLFDDFGDIGGQSQARRIRHANLLAVGLDIAHHLMPGIVRALQFLDEHPPNVAAAHHQHLLTPHPATLQKMDEHVEAPASQGEESDAQSPARQQEAAGEGRHARIDPIGQEKDHRGQGHQEGEGDRPHRLGEDIEKAGRALPVIAPAQVGD